MGISRLEAVGIRNKGSKVRESTHFAVDQKGLKRLLAQEGAQKDDLACSFLELRP